MGLGLPARPRPVKGLHHPVGRIVEIGQKLAHLEQGLVGVLGGVEDVQDHGFEDFRSGLVPDRLIVPCAPGIGQYGHQTLDLRQFARSRLDLRQRIPARGRRIPRREIEGMREPRTPAGRDPPQFALWIMHQDARGPRQQGRGHMAPPLAAAGPAGHQRRPKIGRRQQPPPEYAQDRAGRTEQARAASLGPAAPSPDPTRRPTAADNRSQPQAARRTQQDQRRAA